jgi:hypothetical protein
MLKTDVIHELCLQDSFLWALHSAQTTKPFFQLDRSELPTFQNRTSAIKVASHVVSKVIIFQQFLTSYRPTLSMAKHLFN